MQLAHPSLPLAQLKKCEEAKKKAEEEARKRPNEEAKLKQEEATEKS